MERVARIYKYGPPEVLTIEPIETPRPGPGQALIRNTAIGLNFVEVYFRRGTFEVPALPAVLGNEGAGVVEAVGPGVDDVSVGDRVVYADGPLGSYATARVYPADRLVRIPDGVSDVQVAASFLRGVTARMLLKEVVSLRRTTQYYSTQRREASDSCSHNGRGRSAFASLAQSRAKRRRRLRDRPAASKSSTT
jgi:NADPH:quinone reductase